MHRGRLRRSLPRVIAGPIVLVLLAGTAAAGPADTRIKISDAKARLKTLEERISTEQARALAMNTELKTLAGEVGRSRRAYEAIQDRLVRTKILRDQASARYQAIRGEIDRAAAEAYMRGPAYAFEAIIRMESLSDVADVLAYTDAIATWNAELADEVSLLAFELKKREQEETVLMSERTALHSRLTSKQKALTDRFVEQQLRLAALARDRAEAGTLLARLREQLLAEEIAAAEEALAKGTPLTFGEWATVFLRELHAPVARNNLVVMVAWQVAEYTQARWNPLATTYPMPGSTEFNGSGVRNFVSLAQGLDATRRTLSHCCYGYEAILANLARNADPMTTGQAIHDSRWCRGCAGGGYVIDLIPTVEQYYDDYASKSA